MENAKPGFVTEAAINFEECHLIDTTYYLYGYMNVNHSTGWDFRSQQKTTKGLRYDYPF
jgi:hypothetical protein